MAASTLVRNFVAGYTAPLQWTDTGGGTAVEFYTPRLQAATLSGVILARVAASMTAASGNAAMRLQVAVVNSDGTGEVIYGEAGSKLSISAVPGYNSVYVAGPDTAIAAGQRLRFRFYVDDYSSPLVSTASATLYFNQADATTSGWATISMPVALAEYSQNLSATAVNDATDAFGTPTVTALAITLTASAVNDSTDAFGAATVSAGATAQTITASGVANSQAYGAPQLNLSLAATSVPNTQSFGTPTTTPQPVTITASSVDDSTDGFGGATITTGAVTITATSVTNSQAFGAAALTAGSAALVATAVENTNDFGTAAVTVGPVTLDVTAVENTSDFGTADITVGPVTLTASSVTNSQAFGDTIISTGALIIAPDSVSNLNEFGSADVTTGPVTLDASSVVNSQEFGSTEVTPVTGPMIMGFLS